MSVETSALLLPFDLPEPAAPGAEVEWLIDNANAYRALIDAIRTARATIWITQLALDADCVAYDVPGAGAVGVRIVDELLEAARRGVEVRVLLNASLLLDTAAPLRAHLTAGAGHPRLRVRGVSRFPQLLHAKMVIVDETAAFLVGSPFANGYWDDSRHRPRDARRPMRELGGRPVHDVSTRLVGNPVRSLATIFADLWNEADDVASDDVERLTPAVPGRPDASAPIAIVRTGPGDDGPMEILPALLDGIASARETIYIEHQYLSSRPVADALQRALSAHQALELVVVLNQNPDVTAYRGWQNDRLRAAGLLDHPRVGLFALWTSASAARSGHRQVNQVFVHSKVVLVDDRWALVGSANLDGVSLHSYGDDFTGVLGRRLFRRVRNFDVNLVVSTNDAEADGLVRSLRAGLWGEHLGSAFDAAVERPTGGWLPLWRAVAGRNADALSRHGDAACVDGSFVLPYSAHATPSAQLADIGVLLAPGTIELCFNPSWLEVRFSPSWVRNMFA